MVIILVEFIPDSHNEENERARERARKKYVKLCPLKIINRRLNGFYFG